MTDLQYPIGRFTAPGSVEQEELQLAIDEIASLPADLRSVTRDLNDDQLDTPYRPEGWTVRQVIHHVADSHINSYMRLRPALTENEPIIKPYDEKAWADLRDARHEAPSVSLDLLDALHRRWTLLLRSLTDPEWGRSFRHPERGLMRLDVNTLLYAWHGKHHVAHIAGLRQRQNW